MADNLSQKRSREIENLQEKPLKLLKHSHMNNKNNINNVNNDNDNNNNNNNDDDDDDDDDDIKLEDESDVEEPSLIVPNDLTSQLMAINSTLLLNKNILLSNMAQSLIMQSTFLVMGLIMREYSKLTCYLLLLNFLLN